MICRNAGRVRPNITIPPTALCIIPYPPRFAVKIFRPRKSFWTHIKQAAPSGFSKLPITRRQLHRQHGYYRCKGSTTISVSTPHLATPAQVLSAVRSYQDICNHDSGTWDVVVLISNGLAHWLIEDISFLSDVLSRAFPIQSDAIQQISYLNVVLAVVDQISSPAIAASLCVTNKKHTLSSKLVADMESNIGSDGIALYVSESQMILDPVTEITGKDQEPDALSRSKYARSPNGTVNFSVGDITADTLIEVPLANTMFTTGSSRNLSLSSWIRCYDTERFVLQDSTYLHQVTMDLRSDLLVGPYIASQNVKGHTDEQNLIRSRLEVVLQPLTQPRKVLACIGNVIRRIESPMEGRASHELELAVQSYFEEAGKTPTTAAVWALIIPRIMSERSTQSEQKFNGVALGRAVDIGDYLTAGASLHKVLSGGGGWQHEGGLLSIDPETDYGTTAALSTIKTKNSTVEEEVMSMLGERSVNLGDHVQFFVESDKMSRRSHHNNVEHLRRKESSKFVAGVTKHEELVSQDLDTEGPVQIEQHDHHFGVLSHIGIGYIQYNATERRQPARRAKITVPLSLFHAEIMN